MKFKVGDKVRITDRGIFRFNYRVGDTATIESIHDDLFVLSMRGGGKQNVLISHADEYIEKVEECAMKFKVGDRVSIDGLTGTIDAMGDDGYLVAGCWYDEEQLTAAPSKLAELLGVKDDTPFDIVDSDGSKSKYAPFMVSDGKIVDCDGDARDLPLRLLTGEAKAVPIDGEWHDGMTVYYVNSCGEVNEIDYDRCDDLCVALILLGNAFTTEKGAESAAERINADIIEKLGEC